MVLQIYKIKTIFIANGYVVNDKIKFISRKTYINRYAIVYYMFEFIIAGFTGTFFSYYVAFSCGAITEALIQNTLRERIEKLEKNMEILTNGNINNRLGRYR